MNKELKQKFAILFIVMLTGIKFFILPEFELQNEKLSKIEDIKKNNSKYEYLLSQEDKYKEFQIKANQQQESVGENIPVYSNVSEFQLITQQELENSVKSSGLRVRRFIWFNDDDKPVTGNLYKKRMRLVLYGKTKKYIELHTWLKQNEPKFRLDNMVIEHGKNNKETLGYSSATFIVSTFYFKGEA